MLLEKMSLIGSSRLMDKSLYHYQAASVHWHRRDLGLAYQHGQTSIELALATGTPLPVALTSLELAFTLFEQGDHAEARAALARGAEAGRGMKHIEFMNGLYSAHFALQSGEHVEALATLRTVFALGAREGYVSTPRWNNAVVAPLCALALEHDVEVEYVRGLIRRRGLEPTADTAQLESWPWAVRIRTLGEFSVQVNEQPLVTGRKSQQKQLTLLKVLAAIGPAGIGAGHLAAWLWPDADGDKAHHALEMAIHRVRKLLGREDALLLTQGQLRLNTLVCWVDSNAFAACVAAALVSQTGTIELLERAVHLYRGHFLEYGDDAEPWVLSARDRLKVKFLSAVEKLCALYEAAGEDEKALSLCRRSVEVDELSEEIYRCYIRSCLRLDRETEATDAFRRLERGMKSVLGTTPSRKTAALLLTPL
jgi:DNA-binding SARP family transcriptional activator